MTLRVVRELVVAGNETITASIDGALIIGLRMGSLVTEEFEVHLAATTDLTGYLVFGMSFWGSEVFLG